MRQPRSLIYSYAKITAQYTVTTSFANIPGLSLIIPSPGTYEIKAEAIGYTIDNNGPSPSTWILLASDGVKIDGTPRWGYISVPTIAAPATMANFSVSKIVDFDGGEVITVQAKMNTGNNCTIRYNAGTAEGYIMYRKLARS